MAYIAYHFTVNPPQPGSEILMAFVSDFGFESFDATENGFVAYITEELSENVDLHDLKFEDFTFSFTKEKIEQTNWNAEWEKNFDPVVVGNLVCIRAPFHSPNTQVKHEIIIMPKMSFGTGHHQTTRQMCAMMFSFDFAGTRVLDMGCGTGVLAILAHKLGAKDILAIDIDDWSVTNTKENCSANDCEGIVVRKGDVDLLVQEKEFDFILANINKNVLKAHIPVYASKLKKGGKLFLSGFFTTDSQELTTLAGEYHLVLSNSSSEGEWAMLCLEKN